MNIDQHLASEDAAMKEGAAVARSVQYSDFHGLAEKMAKDYLAGKNPDLAFILEGAIKEHVCGGDYSMGVPDYPSYESALDECVTEIMELRREAMRNEI